jgi:hypothetical protein
MDPNIDFIPTRDVLVGGPFELAAILARRVVPAGWKVFKATELRVWGKEWERLYGTGDFQITWHFGGYGHRSPALFSVAPTLRIVSVHKSQTQEGQDATISLKVLRKLMDDADRIAVDRDIVGEVGRLASDAKHKVTEIDWDESNQRIGEQTLGLLASVLGQNSGHDHG